MKKDSLMKKSFVLLLLVSLVAALVLAGLISSKKQQQGNEGNATLVVESLGKTTTEKFFSRNARAIDLLKDKHEVKTTIGGYVKCIDNICVYADYNWAFYVNNKSISLSANDYRANAGDIIRFEFKKRNVGEERWNFGMQKKYWLLF